MRILTSCIPQAKQRGMGKSNCSPHELQNQRRLIGIDPTAKIYVALAAGSGSCRHGYSDQVATGWTLALDCCQR